jgi:hypothetical protein
MSLSRKREERAAAATNNQTNRPNRPRRDGTEEQGRGKTNTKRGKQQRGKGSVSVGV